VRAAGGDAEEVAMMFIVIGVSSLVICGCPVGLLVGSLWFRPLGDNLMVGPLWSFSSEALRAGMIRGSMWDID
jgi:hypothetical protein